MIRATVHSDDYAARAEFDATRWFLQAGPRDIVELAENGWGNHEAADMVALHMVDFDESVERVFDYLDSIRGDRSKKDAQGFECDVNEADAMSWLREHNARIWRLLGGRPPRKNCPGCKRVFGINVIECAACGHKFNEAEVLQAISR